MFEFVYTSEDSHSISITNPRTQNNLESKPMTTDRTPDEVSR